MRLLPSLLAKLFKPMPLDDPADDPITRKLDEVVDAHGRQAADTGRRVDTLRGTIEGVLARLEPTR